MVAQSRKGESVDYVAHSLKALQQHASAETITHLFPVKGERLGDGYNIALSDAQVEDVIVDLTRGRHLLSLPAEGVKFTFHEKARVSLREAVPFCTTWEEMPSSVDQPWLYLCRVEALGKANVRVLVSLSGDVHHSATIVRQVVLTR